MHLIIATPVCFHTAFQMKMTQMREEVTASVCADAYIWHVARAFYHICSMQLLGSLVEI